MTTLSRFTLEAFERVVANLLHAGLKDSRPVR